MAILITGGTDAAAYQLLKILHADEVCLADHFEMPQTVSTQRKFIQIPAGDSHAFSHTLLKICLDNNISKVYPLRKNELLPLAESKLLFSEYGIVVFVPEIRTLNSLSHSKHADRLCVYVDGKVLAGEGPACGVDKVSGIFTLAADGSSPVIFAIS